MTRQTLEERIKQVKISYIDSRVGPMCTINFETAIGNGSICYDPSKNVCFGVYYVEDSKIPLDWKDKADQWILQAILWSAGIEL